MPGIGLRAGLGMPGTRLGSGTVVMVPAVVETAAVVAAVDMRRPRGGRNLAAAVAAAVVAGTEFEIIHKVADVADAV
jgi:hypothetical protein